MPHNNVDAFLIDWNELTGEAWKSLLLGNGFSMNIWAGFGYASLFDVAKTQNIQTSLDEGSKALFERLDTNNFEDVLRVLYHASIVDEQLNFPQKGQIDALYSNTKSALASAVNHSHVAHGFNGLSAINIAFRNFQNIFTTNYDLIPYWSIMHDEVWRFKDLFWGEDTTFDPDNTDVMADRCVISYLHGAIHLVELPDGRTKKLTANEINALADLFDLEHPEYIPLFISEGASTKKLSRIKRNDYLRFSFEKFEALEGNLIVIGHSLHKEYDQHLLDALRVSALDSIAIGIWPEQEPAQIILFKSRVLAELPDKSLYFFDSKTHPLGASALNANVAM